jgi:hypothetical protein
MTLCNRCGGALIQKNRWRLAAVGAVLCASMVIAMYLPYLWLPCIVLALVGAYLLVWATLGKGQWCRQCKTFRV